MTSKKIQENIRKFEEGLERALAEKPPIETLEQKPPTTPPSNLDGYIYIPEINLHVAKQRTHKGLNWHQTHQELHKQNLYMPTIPQFIAFIKYLKTDYPLKGATEKQEAEQILDDILTIKNPWRAEWLDARFEKKNDQWFIHYNHRTTPQGLKPQNSEPLEQCLMQDQRIDLTDWLKNPTSQGLPKQRIKQGSLYYWHPRADYVARFGANSVRANLDCYRSPDDADPSLGVFSVCKANATQ